MINNFAKIIGLLRFSSPDEFYFIQILQRNKEHPHLGSNNRRVREYYIHDLEQFQSEEDEIVAICNLLNARAYIHLNRRNRRTIALEVLELLAHNIKCHQYNGVSRIYESVCGKHHSEKDRTWVVDIDTKDRKVVEAVANMISMLRSSVDRPYNEGMMPTDMHFIPTKNGFHIVTPGFDSLEFAKALPDWTAKPSADKGALVEIHKNNPTLLYVP